MIDKLAMIQNVQNSSEWIKDLDHSYIFSMDDAKRPPVKVYRGGVFIKAKSRTQEINRISDTITSIKPQN